MTHPRNAFGVPPQGGAASGPAEPDPRRLHDQNSPAAPGAPVLAVAGGIATITLNRPQHLNRLHTEDLLALQGHFQTLAADTSLHAVVLTATGRAFCAGYHLGELGSGDADATRQGPQLFEQTVDALEALPVPTICRFNGSVYGGATDLGLACDFRVGIDAMELRMPAARLGLHYYPSGLRRYVNRLGLGEAKRLFLLGEAVHARDLLAFGYLDVLASAESLDAEVGVIVNALAAGAPLALRGMKASLNDIAAGTADEAVLRAREALCAGSADLREGLAAFAARRPPSFSGR
ncbi:enoyl-CoA hydratase/carnithine racemase [Burkholderiales bacterium JOSHI_001]|nr:enoyl-CoA hydratase/carnithine racemase [Burkholderiales bacterium JOSHI_001]